ncbi:MAG: hypothetical protein O7D96_03330 [SAR324 cluster bacterium]|nr:hypothetical protein [SAR324 cluster bacterium]
MKRNPPIGQAELRRAIAKYLQSGGEIHKLPEQKAVSTAVVGRKWSNTEIELGRLG